MQPFSAPSRRVLFGVAVVGLVGITAMAVIIRSRPVADDADFERAAHLVASVRGTATACPGVTDGTRGQGTEALEALLAERGPWAACLEGSRAIFESLEEEASSADFHAPATDAEAELVRTCTGLAAQAGELARLPGLCSPFPLGESAGLPAFLRLRGLVRVWSLLARDEARQGRLDEAIGLLVSVLTVLGRTLEGGPQVVAAGLVAADMERIASQLASLLAAPALDLDHLREVRGAIDRLSAEIPSGLRIQRDDTLWIASEGDLPSTASTDGDVDELVWMILDHDRRLEALPCDGRDDEACARGYTDARREWDELLESRASPWMRALSPRLDAAQRNSAMMSAAYELLFWRFIRLRQHLRAVSVALTHRALSSAGSCATLEAIGSEIEPSWDLASSFDRSQLRIEVPPWLATSMPGPALLLEVSCPEDPAGS